MSGLWLMFLVGLLGLPLLATGRGCAGAMLLCLSFWAGLALAAVYGGAL